MPPGSFSVGAPSTKASVPSAEPPAVSLKVSDLMPLVPWNWARTPSLSIWTLTRTPSGVRPPYQTTSGLSPFARVSSAV